MSYLGNAPARSFISFERQVFTIVNSQTAYALSHSVTNENDIRLVVNNVVQEPGSGKAYTATGTALTLSAALTNGTDEMYCVFLGRATATSAPGAGSIGTAQLADLNVTSGKIANDAVTLAKMASGTDGNIISYDASGNPVAVATGNDGQVLTSAGAGAPPVFEDVAGGAFTLLKTIDASTASTVEFIDGASGVVLDGTYDNYVVRGTGVITSTTAGVVMRLREGSSFISSTDYDTVSYVLYGTQSALAASGSTGSAYIRGSWQRYSNSTAGFSTNFEAKFYNLPSTSLFKQVYYSGCNTGNDANDFSLSHAAGLLDRSGSRTSACTGIQFISTSGTLTGKFSLYGVTT